MVEKKPPHQKPAKAKASTPVPDVNLNQMLDGLDFIITLMDEATAPHDSEQDTGAHGVLEAVGAKRIREKLVRRYAMDGHYAQDALIAAAEELTMALRHHTRVLEEYLRADPHYRHKLTKKIQAKGYHPTTETLMLNDSMKLLDLVHAMEETFPRGIEVHHSDIVMILAHFGGMPAYKTQKN